MNNSICRLLIVVVIDHREGDIIALYDLQISSFMRGLHLEMEQVDVIEETEKMAAVWRRRDESEHVGKL